MPVIFENMLFSDWRTTQKDGQWLDLFVLRISPFASLPPVEYALGMYRLASVLIRKRPNAALWVQVESPGRWYLETMSSVLRWKGKLPIAVTAPSSLAKPDLFDFHVLPYWKSKRPYGPERVKVEPPLFNNQALTCLQTLGRIDSGTLPEIASLAGQSPILAQAGLDALEQAGLVAHAEASDKKEPVTSWRLKKEGLSLALRSWGIPKDVSFGRRKEMALSDPAGEHRLISRLWPGWLRSAWPHAQVWTGWSEASLPGLLLTPDGLAWGSLYGRETLFWLEVESGHSSREEIRKKIRRRFVQAAEYAKEKKAYLVFALLGREWVCDAARPAFANTPPHVAVTIGDWRNENLLPLTEWGRVEW
jgi:hypothetical protein